jgi:hypothetical protein
MKRLLVVVLLAFGSAAGAAAKDPPTQFWNLTLSTISEFYLAHRALCQNATLFASCTAGGVQEPSITAIFGQ